MNSRPAVEFIGVLLGHAQSGANMRWGTALMRSQQWALSQEQGGFYGDLGRTEQLFGDPAMRIFATPSGRAKFQPGKF